MGNSFHACNVNEPFINCCVTCDGKWIDYDNYFLCGLRVEAVEPHGQD